MKLGGDISLRGFSLVEVTLALGVAGFCLIAVFGLLPVALNSNQAAIEQTAASSILASVIADLRATPSTKPVGGTASSQQFGIGIPASGTAATQTLYFDSDRRLVGTATAGRYRLTISFNAKPAGGGTRSATGGSLRVTWPAAADPTVAVGSVRTYAAFERN